MKKYELSIVSRLAHRRLPLSKIKNASENILKEMGVHSARLSILFCSDAEIRKINKEYLNHDWATDVISFQTDPSGCFGDIVISIDTAQRQAGEYGNDFIYELIFYICHGILHILGWDDATKKQRDHMLEKQAVILKKIGVINRKSK